MGLQLAKGWLTRLDLATGDGDHGINMGRGLAAVSGELDERSYGVGTVRELPTWVGGTSGHFASALDGAAASIRQLGAATTKMQARKGRASYLIPRSMGHQDPGAVSTALTFQALATVMEER